VAIKFMDRGRNMLSNYVEREIINHSILIHPHVIQFKEVAPPSFM
jgi:serine/threonine-protein kinase SRK2